MRKKINKVREELRLLIPSTLFFFIALHLVVLIRTLMLEGSGIAPTTSVSIIVASILLAKAVLIADMLPFINRYPHKPLIFNVVWKSIIYFLISVLIHYSEVGFELWRKYGSFNEAFKHFDAELVWPRFWALQIMLFVMIFMYCTTRELIRVIGTNKVWRIFFGNLPNFFMLK